MILPTFSIKAEAKNTKELNRLRLKKKLSWNQLIEYVITLIKRDK